MISESISKHSLIAPVNFYQTFLSSDDCESISSAYKDESKIDNMGQSQDNLYNTERTGWFAHRNPTTALIWEKIAQKFSVCYEEEMQHDWIDSVELDLFESWIAESQDGAIVEPHIHGNSSFVWSFVFYAKIPNEKSSLNFMAFGSKTIKVFVKEGDLLLFPSNVAHFSTDTIKGRMIYSGNFLVRCNLKKDKNNV